MVYLRDAVRPKRHKVFAAEFVDFGKVYVCVHGVTSYAPRRCLTEEPRSGAVDTTANYQAGYAAKSEDHYQHAHMTISYLYGVIIYDDVAVRKDV